MTSNGDIRQRHTNGKPPEVANGKPLSGSKTNTSESVKEGNFSASTIQLVICVGGIYASL